MQKTGLGPSYSKLRDGTTIIAMGLNIMGAYVLNANIKNALGCAVVYAYFNVLV